MRLLTACSPGCSDLSPFRRHSSNPFVVTRFIGLIVETRFIGSIDSVSGKQFPP